MCPTYYVYVLSSAFIHVVITIPLAELNSVFSYKFYLVVNIWAFHQLTAFDEYTRRRLYLFTHSMT